METPLFVVGAERSGTTLLRMMLDSHPDLAIPPDSLFIVRGWEIRRRYTRNGAFDAEGMARLLLDTPRLQEWGLPDGYVMARVRRLERPDFAAMAACFFEAYAEHAGKSRWGNKTPNQVLSLPLLAEMFPSARFVHIIRDGRNVALSLWRAPFGPKSLSRAANQWAHQVAKGRREGASLGPDRYLEVRYEHLIGDSEAALRRICDFAGLAYTDDMLRYSDRWQQAVPARVWGHHSTLARPPATTRKFAEEMTPDQLAAVECLQGRVLDSLGYERVTARPPVSAALKSTGVLASVAARRAYFAGERVAFHALRRPGLPRPRTW